jgi:hypothetical protein
MRLIVQAEHDNAGVVGGRIGEDVGEVQVERDERSLFLTADFDYALVRLSAEGLLHHGMRLVAARS